MLFNFIVNVPIIFVSSALLASVWMSVIQIIKNMHNDIHLSVNANKAHALFGVIINI